MSNKARPAVRADLQAMVGYHSPQLDVQVRLNTNESALEPPPAFTQALAKEFGQIAWNRYPDRAAMQLREAIAATHPGVSAEQVFVANGSNEVLQTLCLTFGGHGATVATFEPTYAMYAQIARATQARVVEVERDDDYQVEVAAIDNLVAESSGKLPAGSPGAQQPNLMILCSPNNPTGTAERVEVISHALNVAPGVVVVDEAYGQFASFSALELLASSGQTSSAQTGPAQTSSAQDGPGQTSSAVADRLVVVRTFSKTWAMAGLRLGYCVAPAWMVAEFEKVILPYHLDSFKQIAGRLALQFTAEMNQRVAVVVAERSRVSTALAELGFKVFPSQANFVLFDTTPTGRTGDEVWQALVDQSVLIRNCSSWPRLANCLRVTIGTSEENDRFLSAAAAALALP